MTDMTEVPQRSALEQTIDEILKRIERAAQAGPEDLEQLDTDLRKLVENRVRLPFGLDIRGRFSQDVARLVQQIIASIYVHTGRRVVMTLTDERADAVTQGSPHDTATGRSSTRRSSQRRHWPRPLKLRLYDLFEALYDDLLNTIVPALRCALNDVPALAELVEEMGSPIPTMLALGLSAARDIEYTANTTVLPPREHFESKLAGDIEALVDALWDKIQSSIHAALLNRRGRTQHAATMASQAMDDPRMADARDNLARSCFVALQEYAAARLALARAIWARSTPAVDRAAWSATLHDQLARDIQALTGNRERHAYHDRSVTSHEQRMDRLLQGSTSFLRRVVGILKRQTALIQEHHITTMVQLRQRLAPGDVDQIIGQMKQYLQRVPPPASVDERANCANIPPPAIAGPNLAWDIESVNVDECAQVVEHLGLGELQRKLVSKAAATEKPAGAEKLFQAVLDHALGDSSELSRAERRVHADAPQGASFTLKATISRATRDEIVADVLKAPVVDGADDPGPDHASADPATEFRLWMVGWWRNETKLWRSIPVRLKPPPANIAAELERLTEPPERGDRPLSMHPYGPQHRAPANAPRPSWGEGKPLPTATVLVIGGGVAGLTAAHELAERGCHVQVIERLQGPGQDGRPEAVLGGLAASQWSRPPANPSVPPESLGYAGKDLPPFAKRAAPRYLNDSVATIRFKAESTDFEDAPAEIAKLIALGRKLAVEAHTITVSGHAGGPKEGPNIAAERARKVRDLLTLLCLYGGNRRDHVASPRIHVRDMGAASPVSDDPDDPMNRRVEIRQEEDILPGEHGYRFFPSFYRHVFDTMRRIPLYDRHDNETDRTVFDNLIPTRTQVFAGTYKDVDLAREKPRGIEGFRSGLKRMLVDLGFDRRDVVRFSTRMLRFMVSSKQRRADYDDISWWDYVTLQRPHAHAKMNEPRVEYSDEFQKQLRAAPQALVAMDAETCDARTQGNIVVQLMLDQILDRGGPTDCTLNGPTTTAWFAPWRRHLELMGVEFLVGELTDIQPDRDRQTRGPGERLKLSFSDMPIPHVADYDYIVLATDVVTAEQVTKRLRLGTESVPSKLRGFTTLLFESDDDTDGQSIRDRPKATVSDERTKLEFEWPVYGLSPEDRLQIFSGVQFYFSNDLEVARGHAYYQDTDWGLSSISQSQFWTKKRALRDQGVRGILSVDIGDFSRPSRYLNRSASQCPEEALAREVWRQLSESLRRARDRRREADSVVLPIPEPRYYHVDDHLVFSRFGDACTTLTPFLTNNVGDWKHRPGADPWDPGFPRARIDRQDEPDIWQSGHGGYQVHFDTLVFAGTYVRTFTRMTTMEAANESARHAVNAILDHLTARRAEVAKYAYLGAIDDARRDARRQGIPIDGAALLKGAQQVDQRFAGIAGDYCKIFDPERHELEGLEFLKRVDAMLAKEGMPHMFDILGVEGWLDHLQPNIDPLEGLFAALGDTMKDDWAIKTSEILAALAPLKKFGDAVLHQADDQVRSNMSAAARQLPDWIERIREQLKRRS